MRPQERDPLTRGLQGRKYMLLNGQALDVVALGNSTDRYKVILGRDKSRHGIFNNGKMLTNAFNNEMPIWKCGVKRQLRYL